MAGVNFDGIKTRLFRARRAGAKLPNDRLNILFFQILIDGIVMPAKAAISSGRKYSRKLPVGAGGIAGAQSGWPQRVE